MHKKYVRKRRKKIIEIWDINFFCLQNVIENEEKKKSVLTFSTHTYIHISYIFFFYRITPYWPYVIELVSEIS